MIRKFRENDLSSVMQIWIDTNIKAHGFIAKDYWTNHYEIVKEMLPQAELYVYVNVSTNKIEGFIGLMENYIAGIFVRSEAQSKGIGRQLLNYVKGIKHNLALHVYQKNNQAIHFYQREHFIIQSESIDVETSEKEYVMNWKQLLK